MKRTDLRARQLAPLAICAVFGFGLASCVQTPGNDFTGPSASVAAKGAPMDLSATATPTASEPPAKGDKLKATAATATADPSIPTPGDGSATADVTQPESAVAAKTKKPVIEPDPPAAAAFAPAGASPPPTQALEPAAKTVRDDGFPNINMPPAEPSGKLLSPEERAKVITELEALRNRQGIAPQTPQKKPAKKCTDDQIAAGATGCTPPASN